MFNKFYFYHSVTPAVKQFQRPPEFYRIRVRAYVLNTKIRINVKFSETATKLIIPSVRTVQLRLPVFKSII
jgi:hypothetical protein